MAEGSETTLPHQASPAVLAEDLAAYRVGRGLYIYLSPFLLVVGLVGNVISFVVMSRRARKLPATHLYLSVLAVVDVLALYVPCVHGWLLHMVGVNLMQHMGCGWFMFVWFATTNISVYTVVCLTVDRCIQVVFPWAAKRICTLRNAKIALTVTSLLATTPYLHFPWSFVLAPLDAATSPRPQAATADNVTSLPATENDPEYICQPRNEATSRLDFVWSYVDLTIYSLLPFAVLMICNFLILHKMARQATAFGKNKQNTVPLSAPRTKPTTSSCPVQGDGTNQGDDHLKNSSQETGQGQGHTEGRGQGQTPQGHGRSELIMAIRVNASGPTASTSQMLQTSTPEPLSSQRKMRNKTTVMVCVLSVFFLVTTTPRVSLHIAEAYWDHSEPGQEALYMLAVALCDHLMYLNNCLNFIFYLVASAKFREDVRATFKAIRNKVSPLR